MFDKILKELLLLNSKNQDQSSILQNLFLEINTINQQLQDLNIQTPHSQNLLHKVRPEVFNQILEFVDLNCFLNFRLVSHRGNQTVIKMIPNRITLIKQQLQIRASKMEKYKLDNPDSVIIQDLLQTKQNAEQGLNSIRKQDINEMKKFAHPPQVVEKVMSMVCALLNEKIIGEISNWAACQKIIDDIQFLQKLRCLDIELTTDKQLKFFQNIHLVSQEQVLRVSTACFSFYQFIKAIVEIKESKYYKVKREIEQLEKLNQIDQNALIFLQKMTN